MREAGISVCCGGILGMGESVEDRIGMIVVLANLPQHPESVLINMLVQVAGTPLARLEKIDPLDFVRVIAVARIAMPASMVRLSAGRQEMSDETQALCFLAGANSIFAGDKLLTTANPEQERDRRLSTWAGGNVDLIAQRSRVIHRTRCLSTGRVAQQRVFHFDEDAMTDSV